MSGTKESRLNGQRKRMSIIDATLRVIRKQGINQCNHRSVALEAGVPLGSTTYYFKTLDDLLEAALERYITNFKIITEKWFDENSPLATSPIDLIISFLTWTLNDRKLLQLEFEMYAASISRPLLRKHSRVWGEIIESMLYKYITEDGFKVQLIGCIIDTVFMRSVIEPENEFFNNENLHRIISAQLNA